VVFLQLINLYHVLKQPLTMNGWVILGFVFMVAAVMIQFVADREMYRFRQSRTNQQTIIDQGIWRYSRHPNYLGEVTFWWGLFLFYIASAKRLDGHLVFPLLMLGLFLFISIPMMEKKLIHRPGYEAYKKKVSTLFFYRKKSS